MMEETIDCGYCNRMGVITARHEQLDDRGDWRLVSVTPLCYIHAEKAMIMVRAIEGGRLVVARADGT